MTVERRYQPTDPSYDERARRMARRAVLALLGIVASCMAAVALTVLLRPSPIHSHTEQVADLLRRRGVAFREIAIGTRWPDNVNFQYGENVFPYGYNISIRLADGAIRQGWLTCAKLERSCKLLVPELGLMNADVRDFTVRNDVMIPEWLEPFLAPLLP
jgi:hypothetical protein